LFIGFLFIGVFMLTAKVIHTSGLTIASVLSKMSVVIPVLAGIFLYNEKLNLLKTIGIFLALLAVFLINIQRHPQQIQKATSSVIALLVIYFIGSGLVDTSIKYAQARLITPQTDKLYIVAIFLSAFLFGLAKLIFDFIKTKKGVTLRSIAGGFVLGFANFFSLFFVIKALSVPGALSAVTYPVMNVGVLVLSSVTGVIFFKERTEPINVAGIIFAIAAIVMLSI
jgi:drug/metabolite transporter (DMT)-like permease